jgi:hypothetical protein
LIIGFETQREKRSKLTILLRFEKAISWSGFASKVKLQLFGGGIFSDVPKGLRPPAQGCRFGYPGKLVRREISTATRLRRFRQEKCTKQTQPRCG